MESNWPEKKLGDLFKVKHGFAFKGEYFTDIETRHLLTTPGNFSIGGGFQNDKPKYYNGPVPDDYILNAGDIIVTMTDLSKASDTLGNAAIVPEDSNIWLHNQRIGLLEFKDPTQSHPKFVSYLLCSHEYRSWIVGSATGTTVKHTSPSRISEFTCPIPPLPEQKRISHILGSLDDKIELNRQMNATLEGMAQALFKSWFVDFDPVIDNALTAGNPIPEEFAARAETRHKALADGTANREVARQFPAAFQFTEEMGWIPEGWEVVPLGNLLRSVSDTYPLKTVDKVVFLNTGDILDGSFLHQNYSATAGLPGQAKKTIREKDILYSEIRPKNRRFAYVHFDGSNHVVSTKLMVLRATGDISSMFTYLVLKQESAINHLQIMAESRSGTF
ncbi:restriction endonuclease subunit S, partial [Desulfamplus magnetovallimortis]|uniref:restriction endonuclease subunit S n=1 Tax=Desulfamplus magnetovallimortis TaxID=1246637 RepID=UPI0009BBCB2D